MWSWWRSPNSMDLVKSLFIWLSDASANQVSINCAFRAKGKRYWFVICTYIISHIYLFCTIRNKNLMYTKLSLFCKSTLFGLSPSQCSLIFTPFQFPIYSCYDFSDAPSRQLYLRLSPRRTLNFRRRGK